MSLVDPPRYFWNCVFSDLERLSERLEQLGIDTLIQTEKNSSSPVINYNIEPVKTQLYNGGGRNV